MIWPHGMAKRVRELLTADATMSFGECARIVSDEFGASMSRNSIIGWAHRNGIRRRHVKQVKKARPHRALRKRYSQGIVMPPTPPPAVVRPPGWRPDLFELRADECKWPLGDGPFLFCGAKRHNILYPYCEDHLAKAYSKPPR